jgi:hypothetical protein
MNKLNPDLLLKNELQRLIAIHKAVSNNKIKTSRQLRELCKVDLSSYSFLYQNNILIKENGVYVWKNNVLPNTALASTIIKWRNERKEKRKKKEKEKTTPKPRKTISFLWGFFKFNY